MQQRSALIVASTVTAFSLVVVGGVAARVAQPPALAATATPVPVTSPTPDITAQETAYLKQVDAYYQQQDAAYKQQLATDQQNEAVYQQREVEYQKLIAQANKQLQDAYAQIEAAKTKKPAVHTAVQQASAARVQAPQPTATQNYAISAQYAASLAMTADPGTTLLATPELVSFEGTPAYEVRLNRGNVYVDATSGAVLYNGAVAPTPQTTNANHSSNNGQGSNGTHSGGSDDHGGGGDQGGGGGSGGNDD